MSTCISKKTNVQIIRSRTACNSKTQTTALWQRPVGPPVAPSITSVVMELLGTAILNISPPKTDGGARVTSYIVTSSPGQVRATFKPDQIKAAKISGLTPGNTYSFSVVAVNSKGRSPASLATSPARAPIPVPVPTPQPVQQPVPLPIQVSEPVPVPVPTPTPTLRTISSPVIAGVTAPVTGARPVAATTAGTGYTGTVTWSGTPRFFASVTTYTATITLTATSGYTLTGVSANYFTVAGATSITHSANSGVITAVFPATSLSIPVFTLTSSIETRTVNSVATGFTVDSTGDAIDSFSITPSAPAGMSFNTTTGEFTGTPTSIADAIDYTITATNAVGSATRTFTFTVTAPITISDAPIGGVAVPVTGSDPARTTTAGTGYTGTVTWSGSPKLFSADTTYTATITLTPISGYTLNGVTANFFTVAGATSVTHSANSGVITAVFPATAKLSQSITFATPIDMTVGGSTQEVVPTATSRLTVTLTSTTTGVCTVLEFVITAVASGTCSITASQTGNANYEAAPDVTKTFASRATQSITFTFFPADVSFGTNPAGLGAISTSGLTVAFTTAASDVCTVSGTTVTVVSVGTCTINANQAGNLNFEPASQVAQSFTIAKATPSLSSFANVSKTVGDASFSLTAPTVANSLLGSFTYTSATTATATISGATVTLGSAGTTLITATFTPTDAVKYNNATITMTLTLSVAAPAFTLSSSSETRTVNTAATGFSINSTGGAIASFAISATPPGMSFDTSTGALTGTPTTVASATAYTVTATNATGTTTQTFTLTVSRATQATLSITSLTTSSKAYPYEQALSITTSGGSGSGATTFAITSGGSASNCALSNSTSTATITATTIGTCRIQATKAADSTYDEITSAAATFIFDKTSQSITFTTPLPMRFGGSNQSVTPTASSSLTVTLTSTSTGICTVAGFVITAVGSGTCSITASQAGNSNYLAAFDVIRTFGILKATQSISFTTPSAMTVGESNQSVSPTSSSSLTVTLTSTTLGICTVAGFVITAVSPGTCSITASRAGNTNYEAASDVIQTFAITGVINVAAIAGVTAPVSGATPVNTTTAGTGYTGAVSWASSGGSLVGNFAAATIYTATITLTATSNYTLSGVSANFFTVAGATSVTHSADSGVITAVFPATAKLSQSITFTDPADISYGISPSSLSATSNSGLTVAFTSATSGVCTVSGTTVTVLTAGTCTLNANQAGNANYEAASQVSQSFTIAKASQSITFTDPVDITYGQSPSSLSATSASTLTVTFTTATSGVCTVTGTTLTLLTAGTCTINANQTGDTNYEAASQVAQSFTIAKATQTITFTTPSAMTVGGSTQTVAPTASSSLTVTLTSTTTSVCTVAGFVITAVGPGTCTITASQAGNTNYEAAPDVIITFSIARTISNAAMSGVTFPVAEGTPVTSVTSTDQYTGTITWSGSPVTFAPTTTYTATITLTPISGYTLSGVSPNFFTVAGATSVTNSADSGIITAVFPATGVGAPRALAISTQPTGAASGSTLGTQPVIRIIDSEGNTVTTYTATIRASISSGSGTLSGTRDVETSSGIAIFTDLAITGTAGTFTLTFTAPTLSNTTSNNLTITTGPATKVVISRASAGTQRRTTFTTQPQITIRDASDNTVTSSTAVVTATITAGPQGSLSGSSTATAVSGVATFNDLGIDGIGGFNYTITYSVDGLTVATSTIALTGINCDGSSFTCKLNDIGPGGGKIFYVSSGTFTQLDATGSMCSTTCKYLEAAPGDLNSIYYWSGNGVDLIGTTSNDIGTGYSNTLKIVTQSGAGSFGAASAARNYGDGWFLPSYDELYQLYSFNSIFGGFPVSRYWSSSEFSANQARYYYFGHTGATSLKGTLYLLVPVRAF